MAGPRRQTTRADAVAAAPATAASLAETYSDDDDDDDASEGQRLLPLEPEHSEAAAVRRRMAEAPASVSVAMPPSPSPPRSWAQRNHWIVLALASGGCAAFNGVFAKLTTTHLTGQLSHRLAALLGLSAMESAVEAVVRASCFGMNLLFNAIMWTLFTKALAASHSATQVSVMNTSSNFFLTALLGSAIFAESLPPLWWVGAALLVVGNVIIGRERSGGDADAQEEHNTNPDAPDHDPFDDYDIHSPPTAGQAAEVAAAQVVAAVAGLVHEEEAAAAASTARDGGMPAPEAVPARNGTPRLAAQ